MLRYHRCPTCRTQTVYGYSCCGNSLDLMILEEEIVAEEIMADEIMFDDGFGVF